MRLASSNHRVTDRTATEAASDDAFPGLRLRLPARPAQAASLRAELRLWLMRIRASEEEIFDLLLAATEAFANAISHAHQPRPLRVEVEATYDQTLIEIVVRDHGQGWSKQPGAKPGIGLTLIDALVDEVAITSGHSGTCVRLRRIRQPTAPNSPSVRTPQLEHTSRGD